MLYMNNIHTYLFFSTLMITRYVLLVIVLLFGLTWTLGVTSAHFQREALVVCFMVALFILCAAVLVRCFSDAQVRKTRPFFINISWYYMGVFGLQIRQSLSRLGKSNEEIGETYEYSARGGGANGRAVSTLSRRPTLASAHSRKSIISHNQVAPHSITPVEEDKDVGISGGSGGGGSAGSAAERSKF